MLELSRRLRRSLITCLAVGCVTAPLHATWTIAVIDTRTGEVVIAGATCLENFGLIGPVASVVVGKGGGVTQALAWAGAKPRIFDGLNAGLTPDEIMTDILNDSPGTNSRQYGVVGWNGPPQTFTGSATSDYAGGRAVIAGDLRYAIQGNILAGMEVIDSAWQTLENSEGDLGQRVMLAMEAAASWGGDGRCSCPGAPATSCGAPPPNMTHSAFTSFIIIARHGDTDSITCGVTNNGCANGDYYARIPTATNSSQPDTIVNLRRKYNEWRRDLEGRADHFLSEVHHDDQLVQADGIDTTEIDVSLVDVNGIPVTTGGMTLIATAIEDPGITLGAVTDHGDGSFSLSVIGGATPGHARVRLVIQDGIRDVQLYPDVEFDVVAPTDLFANQAAISAMANAQITFDLHDMGNPGGTYHLLGSASGTTPGTPWGSLTLPLNRDRFFLLTVVGANGAYLPNSHSVFDATGQARTWANLRSGMLGEFVGGRLEFAAFLPGSPDRVTNVVGVAVVP